MKTITKISMALFLSLSLSLVSCGDDDGGSTNSSGEFVKAKVDGQSFSSSTSFDAVAASNPMPTILMVQGSSNSGNAIQIQIMNFNGEGTYALNDIQSGYLQYTSLSPQATYSSAVGGGATGEVKITLADDEKVEGEFTFKGRKVQEGSTEMKNVTEGKFRAKFQ